MKLKKLVCTLYLMWYYEGAAPAKPDASVRTEQCAAFSRSTGESSQACTIAFSLGTCYTVDSRSGAVHRF